LKPGLAQGVPISYSFSVPRATYRSTAKGRKIKITNEDRSGVLTVTFETASEVFDAVMAAIPLELVGLFTVYEAATKRRFLFTNADIVTDPDGSFGPDAPTFDVQWHFESLTVQPAVAPANIIGV